MSISASGVTSKVSELAEEVLGSRADQIVHETRGVMTYKYIVTTWDEGRFVVRVYPDERADVVNYEPDLMRQAATCGVRVPRVVVDSRVGPAFPLAYVVYEYVPGSPLDVLLHDMDPTRLERICVDISDELRLLEAATIHGFGPLLSGERALFDSYQDLVEDTVTAGFDQLQAREPLGLTKSEMSEILLGSRSSVVEQPVLLWRH